MPQQRFEPILYTGCGLDNVMIHNLVVEADNGERRLSFPNLRGLHMAISLAVLQRQSMLSGQEIKFLRTECGWTQSDLARILKNDTQSIARWEKGANPKEATDVVLRLVFAEHLGIDVKKSIEQMLEETGAPYSNNLFIDIDGSDPSKYEPLSKAA